MPDRIRLQPCLRAAAVQSLDLLVRAHGADTAPGGHTRHFAVHQDGVDELTGVRRALSRGGFSSMVHTHGAPCVTAQDEGVSVVDFRAILRSPDLALRNPESSDDLRTARRNAPAEVR